MYLPHVHVSFAQSLDGRIATRTGDSRYISGPESLTLAHRFRAEYDAIMVGIGTVLADDPLLNCRLPDGCPHQPLRVVLDRKLRLPLDSRIARSAHEQTTIVICAQSALGSDTAKNIRDAGIEILAADERDNLLSMESVLQVLAKRGVASVFVEGGSAVLTSLFRLDLVDTFTLVIAPMLIGAGKEAIGDLGIEILQEAKHFETVSIDRYGKDLAWTMRRSPTTPAI